MANILISFVILIMLFGAYMEKCGSQKYFIDCPLFTIGHKVDVLQYIRDRTYALGLIPRSTFANIASTETFHSYDKKLVLNPMSPGNQTCCFNRWSDDVPNYWARWNQYGKICKRALFQNHPIGHFSSPHVFIFDFPLGAL